MSRARVIASIVVVLWCGAVSTPARAQDPPADPAPAAAPAPPAPAQPASPAGDPYLFAGKSGMISWVVKPGETETFELVWSVIRGRLAASSKADLRAAAASLTLYKMEGVEGEDVTYLFLAHPAAAISYSVSPFLLYQSGLFERPEADELFESLQKATVRVNPVAIDVVTPAVPPV